MCPRERRARSADPPWLTQARTPPPLPGGATTGTHSCVFTAPTSQADARAAAACCEAAEAVAADLRGELQRTSVALDFALGDAERLRSSSAQQLSAAIGFSRDSTGGRLSFQDAAADVPPRRTPRASSPAKRCSSGRFAGALLAPRAPLGAHTTRAATRRASRDHHAAAALGWVPAVGPRSVRNATPR